MVDLTRLTVKTEEKPSVFLTFLGKNHYSMSTCGVEISGRPPPWRPRKLWAWPSLWRWRCSFEYILDEVIPEYAIRNFAALFPGRIRKFNFRRPRLRYPKIRGFLQRVAVDCLRKQTLTSYDFVCPSRYSERVWLTSFASSNIAKVLQRLIFSNNDVCCRFINANANLRLCARITDGLISVLHAKVARYRQFLKLIAVQRRQGCMYTFSMGGGVGSKFLK